MAIVEKTSVGDDDHVNEFEARRKIPDLFAKSGYQGYKIFLDRYTQKADRGKVQIGDLVIVVTEQHAKFPKKELGFITSIQDDFAKVELWDGQVVESPYELIDKPKEKYPEQVSIRVADALASVEHPEVRGKARLKFNEILLDYFVPGGRILAGAGIEEYTMNNCYVIPSPQDSRMGIIYSVGLMAETHARGGGVGVNLSSIRPRFSNVLGVNGTSSGAVSWGELFDIETGLIEQGGSRRGATMLMMWDWHPDIFEFIEAKSKPGKFENTNMSVCISNDFMEAVENDGTWDLVFPDTSFEGYDYAWDGNLKAWKEAGYPIKVHRTVKAREVWNKLIDSAWASAEPGLHFLERSNDMSNSWYFAPLVATNPCGEQPLEDFGVCTLGSINLSKFVNENGSTDYGKLNEVIWYSVRMLDNVIDVNNYHFAEIETSHKNNRRIGLGTMGLGEYLIRKGIRYGSDECVEHLDELYGAIATSAYLASAMLAAEKGSFPAFDSDRFLQSGYAKKLPERVREAIATYGLRNVCLLTQAPTGTTGTMMGTSTGLEPFYGWESKRTSRLGVHIEKVAVLDELGLDVKNLPDYCVTAMDLKPEEHLKTQAIIQRWIDSAVSKTTNVPHDFTIEQTDLLYREAFKMGCKGVTMYRDGSRHEQVLESVDVSEDETNKLDNCYQCGETLIKTDGCVSCPNGCYSACML